MGWGAGNIGGGSGGLNFKVVAYATESELLADTPKENTIGIISTTEMTGWIIDANQPEELTEGMVWISVGAKSAVEFNALKKNGIQVYPISAKQYVSGAWADVTAKSYQSGEWVDWIIWIIKDGQTRLSTGGVLRTTDRLTVTYNTDYVDVYIVSSTTSGIATSQPLNVTGRKELVVDLDVVKLGESVYVGLTKALNAESESVAMSNLVTTAQTTKTGRQTISVKIPSSVSGNYYPCVLLKGGSSAKDMQARIYDFYLQ